MKLIWVIWKREECWNFPCHWLQMVHIKWADLQMLGSSGIWTTGSAPKSVLSIQYLPLRDKGSIVCQFRAVVAEWLRRSTRNRMGYARTGSNPVNCGLFNVGQFSDEWSTTYHDCTGWHHWALLPQAKCVQDLYPDYYASIIPLKFVPGWARTTNLSVNSRTR